VTREEAQYNEGRLHATLAVMSEEIAVITASQIVDLAADLEQVAERGT
jgi:hypothetical protein